MTTQPPPSGPPSGPSSGSAAGPPSGPLSGAGSGARPGPPSGPRSGATSGPGSGAGSGPPPAGPPAGPPSGPPSGASRRQRQPWWRRPGTLVLGVLVVALATTLSLVLANRQASAQVLLQPTGSTGPDPFTAAKTTGETTASPTASATGGTVSGSSVGLYGGSTKVSSCNVPQLQSFLTTHTDKGTAWAQVEGIDPSGIPAYLRALTPVVLRTDTRVTNHGFRDGSATTFQSVLQSGTAVLVDRQGVPRVRCACGNPLTPPSAATHQSFTGTSWPAFRANHVVTVSAAPSALEWVVLYDPTTGTWFVRPVGTHGGHDTPTASPSTTSPSSSASTSTSGSTSTSSSSSSTPSSGSGSASTGGTGTGSGGVSSGGTDTGGTTGNGGSTTEVPSGGGGATTAPAPATSP